MSRLLLSGLILIALVLVPAEAPKTSATRLVVVPTTQGEDCIDLDSRWGVGAILSWKQTICGSNAEPVWVQTDCSQDFARDGFWMATSADGRDFSRKTRHTAAENGSSIAQFACFTVGRQ